MYILLIRIDIYLLLTTLNLIRTLTLYHCQLILLPHYTNQQPIIKFDTAFVLLILENIHVIVILSIFKLSLISGCYCTAIILNTI